MKVVIDSIMIIIMIFLMNIKFIGMKLHEILGIIIFIIFIIHKLLNMKMIGSYFKNLLNKKFKKRYKVLFILDIILFLFIIGIIITGIFISNYIFKDIFIGNVGVFKKIHKFLSWWFLILVSIHLGFHFNTSILYVKNKFKNLYKNKFIITTCIVLYILISLNGIRILVDENIYRNFIPNFTVNHYGRTENNIQYNNRKNENHRKYKNMKNKINGIENKDIHINSISLFDITSILIFFAGGTYFILKRVHKKERV